MPPISRFTLVRVRTVEPLDGFRVRLGFTDQTERIVDLGQFLNGPIFDPVRRDRGFFRTVTVDQELGTIVWPNGADIDPDVLYAGSLAAAQDAEPAMPRSNG